MVLSSAAPLIARPARGLTPAAAATIV